MTDAKDGQIAALVEALHLILDQGKKYWFQPRGYEASYEFTISEDDFKRAERTLADSGQRGKEILAELERLEQAEAARARMAAALNPLKPTIEAATTYYSDEFWDEHKDASHFAPSWTLGEIRQIAAALADAPGGRYLTEEQVETVVKAVKRGKLYVEDKMQDEGSRVSDDVVLLTAALVLLRGE